jgi:carbamoyltransferase
VPAVVHVDGTGRVQTVTQEANGRFYDLVRKFGEATGVPILLNTSFNVMGEPIVETPEDALACLLDSGLDCCVFEDRIVVKNQKGSEPMPPPV